MERVSYIEVRDAAGNLSKLRRAEKMVRIDSLDGPDSIPSGLGILTDASGESVNKLDDGSFKTVRSDKQYWQV